MRKQKRFRNKRLTDADIDLYCRSVEEVLTKIHVRSSTKKGKAKQNKKSEEELVTVP
jgi:hypothetical protein